jgi:hypothetical protein
MTIGHGIKSLYRSFLLVLITLFAFGAVVAILPASKVLANNQIVLFEDFEQGAAEALPVGWKVIVASGVDTPRIVNQPPEVQLRHGEQVLQVSRSSGAGLVTNWAYVTFTPLDDRAQISYWFYATNKNRHRSMNVSITSSSSLNVVNRDSVIFLTKFHQEQTIRAYLPGGGWVDGPFISPNKWHKVTLDIDIKANTFDLYLDDSATPSMKGLSFVNPATEISAIAFNYQSGSGVDSTAPVFVDDLMISTGEMVFPENNAPMADLTDGARALVEQVHPFLIVTEQDYEALRARANAAPWNAMKEEAIRIANIG